MGSLRFTEKNKADPENRILREGDSSRGQLHCDFASPQVAEKLELRRSWSCALRKVSLLFSPPSQIR
jgi:hypothetical protein